MDRDREPTATTRRLVLAVAVLAAALAGLAPFASELPDGLEWAASRLGLETQPGPAVTPPTHPAPDPPGSQWWAKAAAGLGGVALMLASGWALGKWLGPKRGPGGQGRAGSPGAPATP
ncbi:MAG: hypothetical protein HY814_04520 [Candidatus Riflebacteria bacterium]|nr:hypothetical protein [Candidatus Riflebacteria bacterium]